MARPKAAFHLALVEPDPHRGLAVAETLACFGNNGRHAIPVGYDGIFRAELALERSAEQHEARRRLASVVDELRRARGHQVLLRGHDFLLRGAPTDTAKLLAQESAKRVRPVVHLAVRRAAPTGYVPLSVHSAYSFMNSTLTVDAIVALAKQRGLSAIALADTGVAS